MALRDRIQHGVVQVLDHNNDLTPPFVAVRKSHALTKFLTQTVGVEAITGRFVENGAGTYVFDTLLPANTAILNIIVHAEALWAAATSALLEVGLFSSAASPVADDADGFFTAVNLKATDLLAGETLSLLGAGQGGKAGAYNAGVNTHWNQLYATTERILRASVVSVGAGTTGRTNVTVVFAHAGEHVITITQ